MEILVCIKRVPDTSENEIIVNRDGTNIELDDLVYSVNEWDNYAVEEAIQICDRVGGSVTVVTVGDEETEEVVRREMAMGADKGVLLSDEVFNNSDGRGIAGIIKAEVEKGKYDLILTGAQADDGAGQVGGMLAAMLNWPYASLITCIEVIDDKKIKVGREIEDEDNLEIVYDLARAMGGDVACSRPVVDAKWLEKSRQIGTSGKTVKPKVYMALGISGSFQHQGGDKGSAFHGSDK